MFPLTYQAAGAEEPSEWLSWASQFVFQVVGCCGPRDKRGCQVRLRVGLHPADWTNDWILDSDLSVSKQHGAPWNFRGVS